MAKRKPTGSQQPRCPGCNRFIPSGSVICPHCSAAIEGDGNAHYPNEGEGDETEGAPKAKPKKKRRRDRADDGDDAPAGDAAPAGDQSDFFKW